MSNFFILDFYLKFFLFYSNRRQAGIISIPDVIDRELLECDKIIVLGSDGVFEFLSN